MDKFIDPGFIHQSVICGEFVIGENLNPEIMSMGANSIDAMIGDGDDHGQHLPLAAAEGRFSKHDGAIKTHRALHDSWVLAHDADHMPDPAGPLNGRFILASQSAFGLFEWDNLDPGHENHQKKQTPGISDDSGGF